MYISVAFENISLDKSLLSYIEEFFNVISVVLVCIIWSRIKFFFALLKHTFSLLPFSSFGPTFSSYQLTRSPSVIRA